MTLPTSPADPFAAHVAAPSPPRPDWGMFLAGAVATAGVGLGVGLLYAMTREPETAAPGPTEVPPAARKAEKLIALAADPRTPENERRNAGVKAAELMSAEGLVPRPRG